MVLNFHKCYPGRTNGSRFWMWKLPHVFLFPIMLLLSLCLYFSRYDIRYFGFPGFRLSGLLLPLKQFVSAN